MTELGFGGGPVGWNAAEDADAAAERTLVRAWDCGLRAFDTAPYYGHGSSESRLGAFLSGQPRSDYVLSTKVGRLIIDGRSVYDYSHSGTLRSVEGSLDRLGLERIDLLLVHDIDSYTHGDDQPRRLHEALDGALPALAELKAQGVIGGYGLGVNDGQVCMDVARRMPLDAVLLAGRFTLLEHGGLPFLDEALGRGIGVILGGPFNSGILVTGANEGAIYDYRPAPPDVLARVRRIEAVLAGHGVPLPAAALRFPLRHPAVSTVIPGLLGPAQVNRAVAWFEHPIPPACWMDLMSEGLIPNELGWPA